MATLRTRRPARAGTAAGEEQGVTATGSVVRLERSVPSAGSSDGASDGASDGGRGVVVLRLDAPPLNALGSRELDAVVAALDTAVGDPALGAVVVWGGPRAFAAGHDLAELSRVVTADARASGALIAATRRCTDRLAGLQVPTVAAVVGYALGPGLELALACDVRVAADNAKLGFPEVLMGLMPWGGGTQRLPRLVGPGRARELITSGRMVDMVEAERIGLVDTVVPVDDVLDEALAQAGKLVAGPVARALAARAVDGALRGTLAEGLALEEQLAHAAFASRDARVGVEAFLTQGPGAARFVGS
jgi:enoyl-CoA hydratase/carnithine racemase